MWLQGKYKGVSKQRIRTMESLHIYGYVSFGLVLLLLGLIGFTWVALHKIREPPVLESFTLISKVLCSGRDYEVNGFLVSGWSLSLGIPCLPRLCSLIPRTSFPPLLSYCSEVSIAICPGPNKLYKSRREVRE
jgi:hypothetical protein